MENQQNGKAENEESHYSEANSNNEKDSAKLVEDEGLGETADQGEEDVDSGGLAGNAAGNTDAEDQ
jgi:hypothetical protein